MASLLYLKHSFNLSDEELVVRWSENILWQFFSGMDWRCCTDHAEDEVTPTPMRLVPPLLKCGRSSGVQHPTCG